MNTKLTKSEEAILATAYNNAFGKGWLKLPNDRLTTRKAMEGLRRKGLVQYVLGPEWSGNQIIDKPVQSKYTGRFIDINGLHNRLDFTMISVQQGNASIQHTIICERSGDRVNFVGGPTGDHSILADSNERVAAHWDGYLHNNGHFKKIS